ncbi:MAG: hypothetical protein IPG17_27670 [Sandaracinaceae bacterium]|nr:hypothetical protein [Sandaracinaceae bacterium]
MGRQERFGEASDELRALREPLEQVLGPDHPSCGRVPEAGGGTG